MQKSIRTLVTLTTAALAITACGKAKEAAREAAGAINNLDLQHTWQAEKCSPTLELRLLGQSQRESLRFAGGDVFHTKQIFSDADCKDAKIAIVYSGKISKGAEVQKDIRQLDFAYNTAQVVAQNDAGREILNGVKFCDKSDWAVNTPVDLTEKAGSGLCLLYKMPRNTYDIYKIEGDRLELGKTGEQTSAKDRSTELDTENAFRKL